MFAKYVGNFYGSAAGAAFGWLSGCVAVQLIVIPPIRWAPYLAVYAFFALIASLPLIGLYGVPLTIAPYKNRLFLDKVGAGAIQCFGVVLILAALYAAIETVAALQPY